ncbi:hypothetical protein BAU16_04160 [Enterococcus sp. JM9B]|nr:hypothetical protein BAU16_04160 [Enterococcus sp. JM9B]
MLLSTCTTKNVIATTLSDTTTSQLTQENLQSSSSSNESVKSVETTETSTSNSETKSMTETNSTTEISEASSNVQLIDPSEKEIEDAKDSAKKVYEETGIPQTVTAVGAENISGNVTITKDVVPNYFTFKGKAGDKVTWEPLYNSETGLITLTSDDTKQIVNSDGNIPWLQAGYMQLNNRIDMGNNFELTGNITLYGSNATGQSDGIGFAFYSADETGLGQTGGGLGISGLKNGFGFKFDTYRNSDYDDPNFKQFGAFVHNVESNNWKVSTDVDSAKDLGALTKGASIPFSISYNGTTHIMNATYGPESSKKEWSKDLTAWIGNQAAMNFMITASTGQNNNTQSIQFETFNYVQAYSANISYIDSNNSETELKNLTANTTNKINSTEDLTKNEIVIQTLAEYNAKNNTSYKIAPAKVLSNGTTQPTEFKYTEDGLSVIVYVARTQKIKVEHRDYFKTEILSLSEVELTEGDDTVDLTDDPVSIDGYTFNSLDKANEAATKVSFNPGISTYILYYKKKVKVTVSATKVYNGLDNDGKSIADGDDADDETKDYEHLVFKDENGNSLSLNGIKDVYSSNNSFNYVSPNALDDDEVLNGAIKELDTTQLANLTNLNPGYSFSTGSFSAGDYTITPASVTVELSGERTKPQDGKPIDSVPEVTFGGGAGNTAVPIVTWNFEDFKYLTSDNTPLSYTEAVGVGEYKVTFSDSGQTKLESLKNFVITESVSTAIYTITPPPVPLPSTGGIGILPFILTGLTFVGIGGLYLSYRNRGGEA